MYDGKKLCNAWEVIERLGGIELPAQGRRHPLDHVDQEPVDTQKIFYRISGGKIFETFAKNS